MTFDETGLLWINPSPNMRSLTEALLYPGVGLLEATNLATGRGTDTPFERVGAPWIDAREWAAALNAEGLPGVRFVPIRFTPTERQYAGEDCGGVYIIITDRDAFEPIDLGLGLAVTLRRLYPDDWESDRLIRLLADRAAFDAIVAGRGVEAVRRTWARRAAGLPRGPLEVPDLRGLTDRTETRTGTIPETDLPRHEHRDLHPRDLPPRLAPGRGRVQDLGADRALVSAAPRPADRLARRPRPVAPRRRRAELAPSRRRGSGATSP